MKSSTSLRYAGLARRIGAFVLDWLVIAAYILVLTATTLGVFSILQYTGREIMFPTDPVRGDLIAFTTLVLPVVLYFTWLVVSDKSFEG
jgi:uncharacterized RDD family membrane protein YckC